MTKALMGTVLVALALSALPLRAADSAPPASLLMSPVSSCDSATPAAALPDLMPKPALRATLCGTCGDPACAGQPPNTLCVLNTGALLGKCIDSGAYCPSGADVKCSCQ